MFGFESLFLDGRIGKKFVILCYLIAGEKNAYPFVARFGIWNPVGELGKVVSGVRVLNMFEMLRLVILSF